MPPNINAAYCTGCDRCVITCPEDVFHSGKMMDDSINAQHSKAPKDAKVPLVKYPDECWHCGICAIECPTDTISWIWPPALQLSIAID